MTKIRRVFAVPYSYMVPLTSCSDGVTRDAQVALGAISRSQYHQSSFRPRPVGEQAIQPQASYGDVLQTIKIVVFGGAIVLYIYLHATSK